MLGRKAVLAAALCSAAVVGGGAAVAATHGGSPAVKPPRLLPMTHQVPQNVHLGRHHCHESSPSSSL